MEMFFVLNEIKKPKCNWDRTAQKAEEKKHQKNKK